MNSALYVRRFSLNLIRESLLDLVTTRARQLCIRSKLVLYFSEQPNSNELH